MSVVSTSAVSMCSQCVSSHKCPCAQTGGSKKPSKPPPGSSGPAALGLPSRDTNVTWDHCLGHQDSETECVMTGRQGATESGEGPGVGETHEP